MSARPLLPVANCLLLVRQMLEAFDGKDFRENGCICSPDAKCFLHDVQLTLAFGALVDLEQQIAPEDSP